MQNVIERVEFAFKGFFRRIQLGAKPGYPRFQGRRRYDSFTFPQAIRTGVKIQEEKGRVLLHGIGSVKCRFHRPLEGKLKTATVKREGQHWYIVFSCEVTAKPLPPCYKTVGIDLGTNPNFLVSSDGAMVEAPRHLYKAQAKLTQAQRSLSRKKKGSIRYHKAKGRVSNLHHKVANQRRDFHHKTARRLVLEHGLIAHEDLNIAGMARSRTAKGVLDAGWRSFLNVLSHKAEDAGRRVVGVDPRYTSQDCPVCGHRERKSLAVREFRCSGCGGHFHRDVAAAINVLARSGRELDRRWAGALPSGMSAAQAAS